MNERFLFSGSHFSTLNLKASDLTFSDALLGNTCSQSFFNRFLQKISPFSTLLFFSLLSPLYFLLKNTQKQTISCKFIFTFPYFPIVIFSQFSISDVLVHTYTKTEIFYPRKWPKRQGWASIHCSSTPCIITEQHFFMRNAIALRTTLNNK